MNTKPHRKRVLLIDAVTWSSSYPLASPYRDVAWWYARCLEDVPGVVLETHSAEADLWPLVEDQIDGVILSGSPRDAWNGDPINQKLCKLIGVCGKRGLPFLGVCYGHQLLGRALGGTVGRQPQGLELGNIQVELTAAGRRSPLFAGLPPQFEVLASHADAVLELPPGCQLLARGASCVVQGFRAKNLYGVQFHPETDPDTLRFIWSARRETWRSKVTFDLDQVLDQLRPTPLAGSILRNFVARVIP
jgi:GMP synthase (glutamine-hydrolysing)